MPKSTKPVFKDKAEYEEFCKKHNVSGIEAIKLKQSMDKIYNHE